MQALAGEQRGYLILFENIHECFPLESLHSFKREQKILHTKRGSVLMSILCVMVVREEKQAVERYLSFKTPTCIHIS